MGKLTVAKFGGSALGINGSGIPTVIGRIRQMREEGRKIISVFSAPLANYGGKKRSLTDIALEIGRSYAESKPTDSEILREVYQDIAAKYMTEEYRKEFLPLLDGLYKQVVVSLKQTMEYKRFVDVTRARCLAYSGEVAISYAMDYVMKSNGLDSSHVGFDEWPIVTDDNFESANFLPEESGNASKPLTDLLESRDVVSIGGFIGKTTDGLETTYERGGTDRTAADLAILLHQRYDLQVDFEKDNAVLSADPKIVKEGLDYIGYLSYNEAKLAGMFGMKILDPVAIKEIEENNLNIPLVITKMNDPANITLIKREPGSGADLQRGSANPLKIVTGRKRCAVVRMESLAASHWRVSLLRDKRYSEFVQLSPYSAGDTEISRMLFLDGDYAKRNERHVRAYDRNAEVAYGRGVVTLIGDEMWRVPNIASMASSTVGEHGVNIINMDAQEETSRILIIVDDKGENVENAIRAIHAKRSQIKLD
ncbi:MAG: aspartate kinase [Nitrososphaerales archaeon]